MSRALSREPQTRASRKNLGPGHERWIRANAPAAGRPQTADPAGGQGGCGFGVSLTMMGGMIGKSSIPVKVAQAEPPVPPS